MAHSNGDTQPVRKQPWKLVRAWRALMQLANGAPVITADVRNIALGPHDVIVIETDGMVSDQMAEHIRTYLHRIWPRHDVVVMGDSLKIRVVQRSKADAVASRLTKATA